MRSFAQLKATFDPKFPLYVLVMFEQEGRPHVGYVAGNQDQKYQVVDEKNHKYALQENRLHKLPGSFPELCTNDEARAVYLKELYDKQIQHDPQLLWEKCQDKIGETLTELFLCERSFGDTTLQEYVSLRLCLIKDRIYFARAKEGFIPRSKEDIQLAKERETLRQEQKLIQTKLIDYIKLRKVDKSLCPPHETKSLLGLIATVAARAPHLTPDQLQEVEDMVVMYEDALQLEPHGDLDTRAYRLALKLGALKKDSPIPVIRHGIQTDFSPEVLQVAAQVRVPQTLEEYSDSDFRHDLTDLECFTIDDSSTEDMDDALSLEVLQSGFRLGIHISDVAYIIHPQSLLDESARLRATSLYLPDGSINMLPPSLAHDQMSLRVGVVRPAISYFFDVSHDFHLSNVEFYPSIINVKNRLSYSQADELLYKGDHNLCVINNIAALLEQQRIEQGAMCVTKRDISPIVEKGSIKLLEIDENAPSRNMIGEMMVLANTVTANFFVAHSIPALFRTQDRPDPLNQEAYKKIPEGPARDYFDRSRLKRSIVATSPAYHATLGVHAYVQITSPIRRYGDLLLQRQLLNYFKNAPPEYSSEQLIQIHSTLEESLHKATLVSRESKRYWMYKYFEQRDDKNFSGTVVRNDKKIALVELDDFFITVHARVKDPKLGQRASLKLSAIDPRTEYIRLEEKKRSG